MSSRRVTQQHILAFPPILMAARSKAWVCGRSLAGIVGLKPAGCVDVLSLISVVCCQVLVSALGWSLVQRSPTEFDVSECKMNLRQRGGLVPLGLLHYEKEETLAFQDHHFIILTHRSQKVVCKFCVILVENIWCLIVAVVFQNQLKYRKLLMANLEVLKTCKTSKPHNMHINTYEYSHKICNPYDFCNGIWTGEHK